MIYLDNAATTFPKPTEVYDEVLKCMENYAAYPERDSYDMASNASAKIMETRQEISEFFNIPNSLNLVFTSSATEALNIAIKGLLKRKDHVISTVIEHNSVLRPLNYLSKDGVQFTLLGVNKLGYIEINRLKNEIRKNTKAIIINHASNVLGTIQNIREIGRIAREHNITFVVDASQSAGILSVDVQRDNIDLLAFPGHKGLLGPQGTGGLYIRTGINLDNFKDGGTENNSKSMTQPSFLPDKFESGTINVLGIAGLCEGIKFIKKVGRRNVQKHEESLMEYLLKELKKLSYIKIYGPQNPENRAAVVSINVEGIDSFQVGYMLNKYGIAVGTGYHNSPLIHWIIGTMNGGTVRISPGYFNTFEDIENIVNSLKQIYEKRKIA